jgi:hypothetical protein
VSTRPRFWCPPTGRIALDAGGFLADPGGPFGIEQTLETYDEIDRHRCLVLLGEPGIGKTTELARAFAAAGERAYHVDLGAVADAEGLRRLVVEAPVVVAWREGDGELVLFLDAFDEALAERGVLGRALIAELGNLPRERLSLRIACRTADWPATLTDRLALLLGEAQEFELQPVTRADVVAAAAVAGVDGEAFVTAVVERGAGPLARVPLTLRFLLERYARDGALPTRRAELYRDGCRELCREQNPSRVETGRVGTLSAEERLAIAERVAAATVLGGRAAVRLRGSDPATTVVELAELDGGSERTSADLVAVPSDVDVDQRRLQETLATGLFTSRGDDLVGFAHQSYGEFLAARFLHRHRFDTRRSLNLLASERAGRQRVVPQLAGVAAWLADLNADFLDWLIANEPEIALRADVEVIDDARKRALVGALLARADAGRLTDFAHPTLGKLVHPELVDQLQPWIAADGGSPARRLAIELAGAAAVAELYDLLVERVLDEEEEMQIRVEAGWALWRTAPAELRARLKPLAVAALAADLDDDLKGVALLCVWPESLTIEELIDALTPPKRENYLGAYGLFLSQELIPRLTDADLVRMLDWARELGTVGQHRRFASLIDDLLAAAWPRLEVDEVAAALAVTAAALLAREHALGARSYRADDLEQLIRTDRARRRLLIERLLPALVDGTIEPYHLITAAPLVQGEDLRWLLERAMARADADEKRAWARLADLTFRGPPSFEDADAVLSACAADPLIAATIENVYGAVAVDSPAADAARERQAREREFVRQREERERQHAEYDAASPARLEAAIERVENGDIDAYLAVDAELLHKPGAGGIDYGTGDVRSLPNWQAADDDLRRRILDAAGRYLAEGALDEQEWSVTRLAGCRALRLLRAECVEVDLPAPRLGALVPTMLRHPLSGEDDRGAAGELLAFAAERAPDEFVAAVLAVADHEARQHGVVFFLGRLEPVPVGAVDEALCELVRERRLVPSALSSVLEALLERDAPCGTEVALALVDGWNGEEDDVTLAVTGGALLLAHTRRREPAAAVIAAMQADAGFGRRIVERLADRGPLRRSVPTLPEDLTAELFLLAAREFGWDEEGWTGHDIGSWRSSLLARLRDAGTSEAQRELERLQQELPELEWLARVSEESEARTLAATWEPPDPQTVIALAAARSQRYVASGDQLLEAVVDALEVIQQELAADPSWANDLWHRRDGGFEPVSEPEASGWLQRRLREKLMGERGIIFQREVQVTQPPGPWPGDRTDQHVNAVVQHRNAPAEDLTTIVEVKGCWHPDVVSALDTQLVERYLRATANRFGVYLVIWFDSERWRDDDRRRAACARVDRDETMRALAARARELEAEHGLYLRVVALTVRLR